MCFFYLTIIIFFRYSGDLESCSDGALRKRIARFVTSEGFVHRRATHVAQNTRYSEHIISDFVMSVNEQIKMSGYHPKSVVNIDETNVYFDMPATKTLAVRGSRTVSVVGTGSANRVTVVLGASLDGRKIPPFIIFKGQRKPTGRVYKEVTGNVTSRGFPANVVMTVQAKAWMDEDVMLEWIERVWTPYVASIDSDHSFLLMDQFKGHMVGSVLDKLAQNGTEAEFIVGGYTSKLQTMDVGVNRPFKAKMGQLFDDFVKARRADEKPTRKNIANWISEAWNCLESTGIINTWRHIGIKSNYIYS